MPENLDMNKRKSSQQLIDQAELLILRANCINNQLMEKPINRQEMSSLIIEMRDVLELMLSKQ